MAAAAASLRGSPLAYNGPFHDHSSTRAGRLPTRPYQSQQSFRYTLDLEEVTGNTITGSNGFASLPGGTFAVCSGSTAVLNTIAADQTITQRVFRAPIKPVTEAALTADATPNGVSRTRPRQTPRPSILTTGLSGLDSKDQPSKTAVHKKPKGTSCLALSANGALLAVGETGYAPRILLFSLVSGLNTPISITTEHGSGIQSLCFSNDSRWLCSVGDIYDGYIHLWHVTSRNVLKLSASSKCTSIVHDIKWIDDSSLVTAGVRHLKIWRPDIQEASISPSKLMGTPRSRVRQESPVPSSPGLKSLAGRNVLLNDLLESTFTSLCSIGNSKALVASDSGALSIFSVDKGTQRLDSIAKLEVPIRCVAVDDKKTVILAATNTELWVVSLSDAVSEGRSDIYHSAKTLQLTFSPLALGFVEDCQLVCIDGRRRASVYQVEASCADDRSVTIRRGKTYPSHSVAINGSILMSGPSKAYLLTYDACGHVVAWDSDIVEHDIPTESLPSFSGDDINELKVVKHCPGGNAMICGDRYGSLNIYNSDWQLYDRLQAHSGEINDLAVIESPDLETLIATCGRDRAVQVFSLFNMKLALLQTLDQHNGSVNKLEVLELDATLLLSLSSDRTIVIHRLCKLEQSQAFLCVRTITLKSTPLSCSLDLANVSNLIVTTADKQLQVFQISTGLLDNSTRVVDEDDQIALQYLQVRSLSIEDKATVLLLGVSNTDKMLRVHNGTNGELICKASGHSEGITSMTIIDDEKQADGSVKMRIATTSLDGTIMFWKLSCQSDPDGIGASESRQNPLRKVLSRSQLSGFVASLDPNEWSPLPSPTREYPSLRNRSPDRLRRRTSLANLLKDSPTPILAPTPRHIRDPPPTLASPSPSLRRTTTAPESPSPYSTSTSALAENLIGNLKQFRLHLRKATTDFSNNTRQDLKLELEMTLDMLSRQTPNVDDQGQDASYFSAVDGMRGLGLIEEG